VSQSLSRIAAIVRADFLTRFRRVSTIVVFLLLSAFAYFWLPAPSTGRALIQIEGRRAIYNSGAIGMGTASLAMMFVGLFGFYVISNAIQRDIVSRCGVITASTPMRAWEYLLGKFLGNLTFLATFVTGFMLSSMAMLIVRGEASLQPLVFVSQYLLLTPAAIVFVSAIAVLFESIRWLSGKLGDVLYFFVWIATISIVAASDVTHGRWLIRCFDFSGFGFMIDQMRHTFHTDSMSIGSSPFDPTKTPIVFPGLALTRDWLVPRLVSLVMPLVFLPVSALFFHRFDPARTGQAADKASRNWIGRIQKMFKPLSRRVVAALMLPARGRSYLGSMWTDAVLTLTLFPITLVAWAGVTVASLTPAPLAAILPFVFAALAITVSDVSTRDGRAGTTASLYAVPRIREHYVWWKFCSSTLLSLLFCAAPIARTSLYGALPMVALICGIMFIAAIATGLGVLTSNPKTFIVGFLSFWYLVVNDGGKTPALDFAGFFGRATVKTVISYALVGAVALTIAQVFHRRRCARS